MRHIKILVAEDEVLIREGLKSIISDIEHASLVAEVDHRDQLRGQLMTHRPDMVVLDYASPYFRMVDVEMVYRLLPDAKVLGVTTTPHKPTVEQVLRYGLDGHILKCCDREEITDAIFSLSRGDKFFCGKVLDALNDASKQGASCAPINLSNRELEIIRMVAEGLTNKEIAGKLILSTHTIMTHRKNIMAKLGINNTAGIVMYAVKENIISPNRFLFSNTA